MAMQFPHFFSTDNPKAIKAQKLGWLNAINYMAPHRLAGVGDLCGNASTGCIDLCLGKTSGAAALYPTVLKSRIRKAQFFMKDRRAFIAEAGSHIVRALRQARKAKLKLCVRLNGSTDLAWEGLAPQLFMHSEVQFVDYTKSVQRMLKFCAGGMPANYHLTFSRSETNEADCKRVLEAGGNVAVVFAGAFPSTYLGSPVIDGDQSDLRHLEGKQGLIIALSPKGRKAKADKSGFVVNI